MIAFIQGILSEKQPTRIVVDVHGVGYEIAVPISTYEKLGSEGSTVKLLTHHHVREDANQLFGFFTLEEKEVFLLLISVSGIGPKSAIGILSGIAVGEFKNAVAAEDIRLLTSIPGIGTKTAQRIVVELKDKVSKILDTPVTKAEDSGSVKLADEALLALISLGYSKPISEKAITKVLRSKTDWTLQELIKTALKAAMAG